MMALETASLRQRFSSDFHRPRYHFLPPSNWMNDPNGAIQWRGVYHLFYQYNPTGPVWGNIHWGHASSPDLLHWTDLPNALAPEPNRPDSFGCFSGCAVDDNGTPKLFYTSTAGTDFEIQTQSLVTASDDLLTFEKYPDNPVIGQAQVPPEAGQTRDFRDPYVWKAADAWYMVLGSRIHGVGGVVFLYRSSDLMTWEYRHPLLVDDRQTGAGIWECPNFFPLGNEWVLIVSDHDGVNTGRVIYFVGTFEHEQFTPKARGVLDYGTMYAPLAFRDEQGRRLLWGWLRESRSQDAQRAAGWSGVQSIPRVLTLDAEHRLHQVPAPEVEAIRGTAHHYTSSDLTAGQPLDGAGLSLDIAAVFRADSDQSGLAVLGSADGSERVEIVYDDGRQRLIVRNLLTETKGSTTPREQEVPHALDAGEPLALRILVDGSVVELIANERTSLTLRLYPRSAESTRVWLLAGTVESLDIWDMPSVW